jgi:energy-coupling factor transporter ATP-binding protein EcfA2
MKIIESIRIKYYRSILNTTRGNQVFIGATDLNVIVGSNDAGKSNYLRALNLFFNNCSEIGTVFDFWQDFSFQRQGVRREETRIEIELIINPPKKQSFKNNGQVKWKKIWKESSTEPVESFEYLNGGKFTANYKSSYYKWLKKIKFKYVPAIKSQQYFNDLMYDLYDVMQKDTRELENEFNQQIREKTTLISEQLSSRLNIESVLQFKGSFRDLFDRLQFGSKDGKLMLSHRGDGVKVRHIPVILQNIAEEELKESRIKEPKSNTIWGFEEPENNLEYESAKKLADSFIEYIQRVNFDGKYEYCDEGIQIFITTHSPIFYTLSNIENHKISSFYVTKNEDGISTIKTITNDQNIILENEMKLLPLIELSRHWKKIKEEMEVLHIENKAVKEELNSFSNQYKCIFLTEDKKQGLVEKFIYSNRFIESETDVRSYKGCTNIGSTEVLFKYLTDKFPQNIPVIVVHRDKDYMTENEVLEEIEKFKKIGINLFITEGTDIESYFVRKEHILENQNLPPEKVDELLNIAKNDKKQIAITALKRKEFGDKFKDKHSHFSDYIENYYATNEDKLFHGKEVFKKVKNLIQTETKSNAKIKRSSNCLIDIKLQDISNRIWKQNCA